MKRQLCTATKEQELRALLKLWNASYPASLAHESVDDLISYLNGLTNCRHTFLWSKEEKGDLSAWFAVFEREGEPWFAMIVAEGHRKSGIGTELIRTAQAEYNVLNGWVIDHDKARMADGSGYPSPLAFYKRLGFQVLEATRIETDRISAVKIQWNTASTA